MSYKSITIIESTEQLIKLLPTYKKAQYLAVDTETNGVHRFCEAVGVSFSPNESEGLYIPIQIFQDNKLINPWNAKAFEELKVIILGLLFQCKRLVLHNAIFDAKVFNNWLGIDILPYVFCDTMVLAHTVYNEEGPMGLKPLAAKLIDPAAANPQNDVKESVKKNGGSVTKDNFEMYKCNYKILGNYAIYDTIYCMGIFNRLYPEIEKQGLQELWTREAMPLLQVSYDLNNNGINIDVEYFEKLKGEVSTNITSIEEKIYSEVADELGAYEYKKVLNDLIVTPRSEVGKLLLNKGIPLEDLFLSNKAKQVILEFYKNKKNVSRVFNLDSSDDKAFLLFDVLKMPVLKHTSGGRRSTDGEVLEKLCETYKDKNTVMNLLIERSTERKLLTTYIEPLLEHQQDGIIYTGFNQTATVSGRYSSSRPINLQTLPRTDTRIKAGFRPKPGNVLIGDDYSSLEPRSFAVVSNEQKIKDIFAKGLDFYSQIAIDVLKLQNVSSNPDDAKYLGKVDKEKRQVTKGYALAVPYGAKAKRISDLLGISKDAAQSLIDDYLGIYPNLKQWMEDSEEQAIYQGYVTSLVGRKRRANLVHLLYKKYKITDFNYRNVDKLITTFKDVLGYTDTSELYYACKNNLNNAKNFQIQSLAASICNAAMIDFVRKVKEQNLQSYLLLQVHDELIITGPKEEAEQTAKLLQECMEHNWVTDKLDVAMQAIPVISEKSLLEAK